MKLRPRDLILCLILVSALYAAPIDAAWRPDRRRNQFQGDPGWVVAPYVFDLPGIGSGFGLLGALTNIGGTTTDVLATGFGGEVDGQAVGVNSLHLIPEHLILDFGGAHLSRTTLQTYSQRGIGSDRNDYSLAEFGSALFSGTRLTASFDDRRYEAFVGYYGGTTRLRSVRDNDGRVIIDASDAPKFHSENQVVGLRLDLTDDYQDPRRGLQVEPSLYRSPPVGTGPSFFFIDTSVTGYVPVGRRSSWAFNYFRSDAHVRREGETDPAAIQREQGLDCASLTDAEQRTQCENVVNAIAASNRYGSATSLGGTSRLRSYPEQRFKGAHTEFAGAEFRWNLTDEIRPFNIYVMKDVRTTVQVAFFYEIGTVAETRGGLWDKSRSSYGSGLRVVTASGLVYRLDLALGQEGAAPNIFFQYPWQR